jgi:hypothetical protein
MSTKAEKIEKIILALIAAGNNPKQYSTMDTAESWLNIMELSEHSVSHPDDVMVDQFAAAIKDQLAQARARGKDGWRTTPTEALSEVLRLRVDEGDPLIVAAYCAFLWGHPSGKSRIR